MGRQTFNIRQIHVQAADITPGCLPWELVPDCQQQLHKYVNVLLKFLPVVNPSFISFDYTFHLP